MRKWLALLTLLLVSNQAIAETWTTLNMPGATNTYPLSISGKNIVGTYLDISNKQHGFLFNGMNWATIDVPGANKTQIDDIDGNNMVGFYNDFTKDYGFFYDGTNWVILSEIYPRGISGNKLVGYYEAGQGFFCDSGSWTPLDFPGSSCTYPNSIDGNKIVGNYNSVPNHGFLYDGITWETIDKPGVDFMAVTDIFGSNIVGYDGIANKGFLYNGITWEDVNVPGSIGTFPFGISNSSVVGFYNDATGYHGFIYTIPEPSTWALLITALITGIFFLRRK